MKKSLILVAGFAILVFLVSAPTSFAGGGLEAIQRVYPPREFTSVSQLLAYYDPRRYPGYPNLPYSERRDLYDVIFRGLLHNIHRAKKLTLEWNDDQRIDKYIEEMKAIEMKSSGLIIFNVGIPSVLGDVKLRYQKRKPSLWAARNGESAFVCWQLRILGVRVTSFRPGQ